MKDILFLNKKVIVINKKPGMPSQADPSGDEDATAFAKNYLKSIGEEGNTFPVHRLDRGVGGALAIARDKRSAAELSKIVESRGMKKVYLAVCQGSVQSGEMRDFIKKDSRLGMARISSVGGGEFKEALLDASVIAERDGLSLLKITLITGRFHQIRAQLSSRGCPIVGDKKYGAAYSEAKEIALHSHSLSFALAGESISVKCAPDTDKYPWRLFGDIISEEI